MGISKNYGDGDGYGEFSLDEQERWTAYHFIRQISEGTLRTRSGKVVKIGDILNEPEIEMCCKGLHASLCVKDAEQYKPRKSVLTKVEVWGRLIMCKDKLVATHRRIVEVIKGK